MTKILNPDSERYWVKVTGTCNGILHESNNGEVYFGRVSIAVRLPTEVGWAWTVDGSLINDCLEGFRTHPNDLYGYELLVTPANEIVDMRFRSASDQPSLFEVDSSEYAGLLNYGIF